MRRMDQPPRCELVAPGAAVMLIMLGASACGDAINETSQAASSKSDDETGSEIGSEIGDEFGSEGDSDSGGVTSDPMVFAVIGDYGDAGPDPQAVADLVHSWAPDFILTVGDNNYEIGSASTIDTNIGQYYSDYIGDYVGVHGPGAAVNHFWPVPGNHDWGTPDLVPYRDYFTLPGNERYYHKILGDVHILAIDSYSGEPDGNTADSTQAERFERAMRKSTACWNIALLHHPPYSSGKHGSSQTTRWPFAEWGVDLVIAGHDHHYERLEIDGIKYFVNGLGGRYIYDVGPPITGSEFSYNEDHGALRITVSGGLATIAFYNTAGDEIDSVTLEKECAGAVTGP